MKTGAGEPGVGVQFEPVEGPRVVPFVVLGLLATVAAAAACGGGGPPKYDYEADTPFDPNRPSLVPTGPVDPYTGSDPLVLEAQGRYPTGLDLHQKVIMRSCGGANGVCHNQKEYPDMHTAANFASMVGAPCNVQPGDWATVFDRCERTGDEFRVPEGPKVEIAWMEYTPGEYVNHGENKTRPDASSPGLHIYLASPLPDSVRDPYGTGLILRNFVNANGTVEQRAFINFETRWWVLGDRRHLVGEVPEYRAEAASYLTQAGVVQGDFNRNGTFGGRMANPVFLLNPGKPEESYLVGRLRGYMQADVVPGTRMPLANQPPSITDMLALMCFIEALQPGQTITSLSGPIDYKNCSYIDNPTALSLVGAGVTWRGRIWPALQANCGGCHSGASPSGGLDLISDGAYLRLRGPAAQKPEGQTLNLIQPGMLDKSYLWLKISGDGSIIGTRMPQDTLGAGTVLAQEVMNDIEAWITAGALEDG